MRVLRGAAAGALAAALWAAAEPPLGRAFGTPFSDVKLLGRGLARGRAWPAVGLALHVGNGAAFGFAFDRLGLRGVRSGVLVAEVENLVLWPTMAVVDRVHPERRNGNWPPLLTSGRIFGYEVATHALFGVVLGALVRRESR
jgi:hypothetical protein